MAQSVELDRMVNCIIQKILAHCTTVCTSSCKSTVLLCIFAVALQILCHSVTNSNRYCPLNRSSGCFVCSLISHNNNQCGSPSAIACPTRLPNNIYTPQILCLQPVQADDDELAWNADTDANKEEEHPNTQKQPQRSKVPWTARHLFSNFSVSPWSCPSTNCPHASDVDSWTSLISF